MAKIYTSYPYKMEDWTPFTDSLVHYAGGFRLDLTSIYSSLDQIIPSRKRAQRKIHFEALGGLDSWLHTTAKPSYDPKRDSGFTVKTIFKSPDEYEYARCEIELEVFISLDVDRDMKTFDIGYVMVSCKAKHTDRERNYHERQITNDFPSTPFVGLYRDLARTRVKVLETLKNVHLKDVQAHVDKEVKTFFRDRFREEWCQGDQEPSHFMF